MTVFPSDDYDHARCRQQPHGCRFIGTLAALQEHRGFCNATWDELVYLRAQSNVTPQISRHLPVKATILTPHAPAPPPGRQETLPPTPTSSLAGHPREGYSSQSSLAPASEASPGVTISKLTPKHNYRSVPAVMSQNEEASISPGPAEQQLAVQSRVVKGPSLVPSRSSSASLESLLAEHDGGPEGHHPEQEAVVVEELQLTVSPWVDSLSPTAQRPAEKRKSPQLKDERRAATGSNGRPKKRQRVEKEQVTNTGRPEDRSKWATGTTLPGTEIPLSSHTPQHSAKKPYNGAYPKRHPLD